MKKLLGFVVLPQCILAVLLAWSFLLSRQLPGTGFTVSFILGIILNIMGFVYYLKNKQKEKIELKVLYFFLIGLFIIFSAGISFLYKERLVFPGIPISVLYLSFNVFSMIYLAAAIIKRGNEEGKKDIVILITLCIIFPVVIFILLEKSSFKTIIMMLSIGFLCLFFLLIGKLTYMLYIQNSRYMGIDDGKKEYTLIYRLLVIITCIILPVSGLILNKSMFGVFGDFSSIWFYIISVLNGLVLLVDINKISAKLPVFYLKTAGFIYIIYFTVIFIPNIPVGLLGIVLYGLGLFVLVPMLVFYIQFRQILRDIKILKKQYSNIIITVTVIIGALTIPAVIAANFKIDSINFQKAMVYIESGTDSQNEVNLKRLERSVIQIENTMTSSRENDFIIFRSGTPLLSTVYRYIVFDNRLFTEKTNEKLQKVFLPEKIVSNSEVIEKDPLLNKDFDIKISTSGKEYIEELGVYKLWVDMEITLKEKLISAREYSTDFILPEGSFITDYYLYVGKEKKLGIMTDKRAALVAYESIIRTPKDPGIIYYDNDNKLSLRVFPFPFEGSRTRKTGFQIMYSQSDSFSIDETVINLEAEKAVKTPIQLDGVQYLPAEYKKSLPELKRKPQYYFLVDAGKETQYKNSLDLAIKYSENKNLENPVFYAVSYQAKEIKNLKSSDPEVIPEGGFNTAYAVEKILPSVPQDKFPVFIMVTENINRATEFEKTQMAKVFPETDYYYRLNSDLSLVPYDFYSDDMLPKTDEIIVNTAVNYNGTAVRSDDRSEIVYSSIVSGKQPSNDYEKAFILQKKALQTNESKEQISIIREAMQKRILTKNTAFIVMETKEQEETLLDLQKKFLKGNKDETPSVMMSESGWGAVAVIILIVMIFKRKYRKNKKLG